MELELVYCGRGGVVFIRRNLGVVSAPTIRSIYGTSTLLKVAWILHGSHRLRLN